MVLDAYEAAFGAGRRRAHRFRVEHAQVLAPADVPRFKALGVIPSMQPTHCTSDMYWAPDRLGPERAKGAYLWKTFLAQGVPIAGGSDAPVEYDRGPARPLRRGHAPGRQGLAGGRLAPRGAGHDRARRWRCSARGAAFAAFEEDERGTIAPGKRADLTVFTGDVTAMEPAEILRAQVSMTVVGGEVEGNLR